MMSRGTYPFIWNAMLPPTSLVPSNSFATIQTDFGTFPSADSPADTLTLTSSDTTVVITGNALTDEIDFSVNEAIINNIDGGAPDSVYGGLDVIDGGVP
jgi:hypothetical protein